MVKTLRPFRLDGVARALVACTASIVSVVAAGQAPAPRSGAGIPETPITFGAFTATFGKDGSFALQGQGWPALKGTWTAASDVIEISTQSSGPGACAGPGRYTFRIDSPGVTFTLVSDACDTRRLILDGSSWLPVGMSRPVPTRRIVRTAGVGGSLPKALPPAGSWPSFRGPQAAGVADGQRLPDHWDVTTGENILWRAPLPGLAHSSPIVWGDRIYITTAISSDPKATFKKGLYGDGDASTDRSRQRWVVMALDKRTGKTVWERVAYEGEPIEKRHIKSTYASATPVTDGRIVVAWFGSQGVYAYDVNGALRWKVDLGRLDLGAYDVPTVEWGTASSPIIWNDLVILQVDTQADSFLTALNAETGQTVWKTDRDELPSWGTPNVLSTSAGPMLVTNAAKFIRGYDPRNGKELWKLGGSSKITAPTPISSDDFLVVVSGRGPERPIFVVKAEAAKGDLTLGAGRTSSDAVVWSKTGRGSYMPTPIIVGDLLYVLGNNGIFDAYRLKTGEEVYRQRLPVVGSGFSASPVAADGKIYLSSEDGDIVVIAAGPEFKLLATNTMGESLMATPALSDGVMYVRSSSGTLFAVGTRKP